MEVEKKKKREKGREKGKITGFWRRFFPGKSVGSNIKDQEKEMASTSQPQRVPIAAHHAMTATPEESKEREKKVEVSKETKMNNNFASSKCKGLRTLLGKFGRRKAVATAGRGYSAEQIPQPNSVPCCTQGSSAFIYVGHDRKAQRRASDKVNGKTVDLKSSCCNFKGLRWLVKRFGRRKVVATADHGSSTEEISRSKFFDIESQILQLTSPMHIHHKVKDTLVKKTSGKSVHKIFRKRILKTLIFIIPCCASKTKALVRYPQKLEVWDPPEKAQKTCLGSFGYYTAIREKRKNVIALRIIGVFRSVSISSGEIKVLEGTLEYSSVLLFFGSCSHDHKACIREYQMSTEMFKTKNLHAYRYTRVHYQSRISFVVFHLRSPLQYLYYSGILCCDAKSQSNLLSNQRTTNPSFFRQCLVGAYLIVRSGIIRFLAPDLIRLLTVKIEKNQLRYDKLSCGDTDPTNQDVQLPNPPPSPGELSDQVVAKAGAQNTASLPQGKDIAKKLLNLETCTGFEVVRKLGSGGFGCVLEVCEKKSKEVFALKIIKVTPKLLSTVQTEIDALRATSGHPSFLTFYGFYANDKENGIKEYGLFTEMFKSVDLYTYCHRHELRQTEVQCILFQLGSALRYLHSLNIIHCDVKRQNILIDENLEIKLIDLGLCRKGRYSVHKCGTKLYLAPEVTRLIRKKSQTPYSYSVDYYAVGAVHYAILYGRPPPEDDSFLTIMEILLHYSLKNDDIVVPEKYVKYKDDITKEDIIFVAKLLNYCPEARLNDATFLSDVYFDNLPTEYKKKYLG